MTNTTSSGSVVLRHIAIDLASDVGAAFTVDCCRHIEGLISAEQLRKKYELDDDGWAGLAENEPLQRLVGREKERRILNGTASRERAAHLFVEAPNVLGDIIKDTTASAKNRVDAIRELRACTGIGPEANTAANDRERFIINISFGQHKLQRDIELKPIAPERDLKIIEPTPDGEDEYEPPEYDRF